MKKLIVIVLLIIASIVVFYWPPVRGLWLLFRHVNREMVSSQVTITEAEPVLLELNRRFRRRAGSRAGIALYFPHEFDTSPCAPCVKLPNEQKLDVSCVGLDKKGRRYTLEPCKAWHDGGKPVLYYSFDPLLPWGTAIVQLELAAPTNVVIDHIKWLDGLWK
jgi:hypothetical protein